MNKQTKRTNTFPRTRRNIEETSKTRNNKFSTNKTNKQPTKQQCQQSNKHKQKNKNNKQANAWAGRVIFPVPFPLKLCPNSFHFFFQEQQQNIIHKCRPQTGGKCSRRSLSLSAWFIPPERRTRKEMRANVFPHRVIYVPAVIFVIYLFFVMELCTA